MILRTFEWLLDRSWMMLAGQILFAALVGTTVMLLACLVLMAVQA